MPGPKEYYRIIKKDGNSTCFHFIDSTLIPISNFELALKWHSARELMGPSFREMEALLSNRALKKKYRRFLENANKIFYLGDTGRKAVGS
ncbi:MAG: hypothetical protein ABFD62_04210 [Syntrophaceae bacterium]